MDKIFTLYDSKLKKHYLVSGRFTDLLKISTLRLGKRNKLDRFFLWLQSLLNMKISVSKRTEEVIKNLNKCFETPVSALLLFDTSWYKETLYIGYVQVAAEVFFVKIHRNQQEALFHKHQASFVQQHFSDSFVIVPVIKSFDNVLIYPYINSELRSDITENIVSINLHFLEKAKIEKPFSEILPTDIYFIMEEFDSLLAKKIKKWAQKQENGVPLVPAHGDMVPWNTAVNADGKMVLYDYEQAGWHTILYDYFHYLLQPIALQKNVIRLEEAGLDKNLPYFETALTLYLIDQLYQSAHKIKQAGYGDKPFKNQIKNKSFWLAALLDRP